METAARARILQVDLKKLGITVGITGYGELGPRGGRRYYLPAPLELFVDGKPMQVARWPNAGEKHIAMGRVHDKGSTPRKGDYSFRPGTFEYGVNRPTLWTKATAVRFENLLFEVTRGSGFYIERGASNEIVGCTLRNMGIIAVQMGKGIKRFPYGKHDACGNKADGKPGEPVSRQRGSWHEHIYKYTAWEREAGTGHRIAGCDRKTLTPGSNAVVNCDIYRVNRWDRTYKAPVNIDGVGNIIRNNHLHDCEGMAVYLHGNDHIVEFNEIDHVCTDISDQGSIYMGRDPSEAGSDFRLKKAAEVFTEIPGFVPIPFEKIGLRVDEARQSLPLKPPTLGSGSAHFVGGLRLELTAPLRASHIVYTLDGSEPDIGSPRYAEPIALTATTLVKARAVGTGERPAMSETVSRRFKRLVVKPVREVRINFQPATAPKPMGYLIDSGRAFHVLQGGSAFGWSEDNQDAARERKKHGDPLRDTLVHFTEDYRWEISVFNATYELTICIGDAEHPSRNQTIYAEGKEFCSGLDLEGGEFKIIMKTVKVKDGLLTLHSRNVPHGPELTRMNWLTLRLVGE